MMKVVSTILRIGAAEPANAADTEWKPQSTELDKQMQPMVKIGDGIEVFRLKILKTTAALAKKAMTLKTKPGILHIGVAAMLIDREYL